MLCQSPDDVPSKAYCRLRYLWRRRNANAARYCRFHGESLLLGVFARDCRRIAAMRKGRHYFMTLVASSQPGRIVSHVCGKMAWNDLAAYTIWWALDINHIYAERYYPAIFREYARRRMPAPQSVACGMPLTFTKRRLSSIISNQGPAWHILSTAIKNMVWRRWFQVKQVRLLTHSSLYWSTARICL